MREKHGLIAQKGMMVGSTDININIVDGKGETLISVGGGDIATLTPEEAEYLAHQLSESAARARAFLDDLPDES